MKFNIQIETDQQSDNELSVHIPDSNQPSVSFSKANSFDAGISKEYAGVHGDTVTENISSAVSSQSAAGISAGAAPTV